MEDYKQSTMDIGENWESSEATVNVPLLRSFSQASLVCRNVVALTMVMNFLALTHFCRMFRKPPERDMLKHKFTPRLSKDSTRNVLFWVGKRKGICPICSIGF